MRFTPTISPFRRATYSCLRDIGTRRDRAAEIANISISSARRLDAEQRRCGLCGRPTHREDHDG
jgi:hypothetical protein